MSSAAALSRRMDGRADRIPGLYTAVMHSGITLAPAIGRLIADEVLTGRRDSLLEPYGLERFSEARCVTHCGYATAAGGSAPTGSRARKGCERRGDVEARCNPWLLREREIDAGARQLGRQLGLPIVHLDV
jgi:hypothetical protein